MAHAESSGNSSVVSIFAMVLLVLVVIAVLYFVVYRGFFNKKTEIDVNVNPGGSYLLQDTKDAAFNHSLYLKKLTA
jgi:hypothetical protein